MVARKRFGPGAVLPAAALIIAELALVWQLPRLPILQPHKEIIFPVLCLILFPAIFFLTGDKAGALTRNFARAGITTWLSALALPRADIIATLGNPVTRLFCFAAAADLMAMLGLYFRDSVANKAGTLRHRLLAGAKDLVPASARAIMAAEARVYLALLRRGTEPVPAGASAYTYHRSGNDFVICCALVASTLVEVPLLHVLLHRRFPTLAWALTDLGLLAALYLAGVAKTIRQCPILLDNGFLHLRLGLAKERKVALQDILALEPISSTVRQPVRFQGVRKVRFWLADPPNLALLQSVPEGDKLVEFRADEPALLCSAIQARKQVVLI